MATKEQKNVIDESPSEVPSDQDLFAGEVRGPNPKADFDLSALGIGEGLSEREAFAGDEDFYSLLAKSAQPLPASRGQHLPGAHQSALGSIWHKRFSPIQTILIVSIVTIAAMLLYTLLKSPLGPVRSSTAAYTDQGPSGVQQTHPSKQPATDPAQQVVQQQVQKPGPALSPTQPLSLNVARSFYLQKDYDKAYAAYDQLRQALPASEELLRDFLQLKMALCAEEAADFEQASRLLVMVSNSRSPVVSVVANHRLSLLEIQRKRYLRARTRAYQAIALIKAAGFEDDWALSLECDGHFLVAECLTRSILSLSNADTDLPEDLWGSRTAYSDPFDNLTEAQLRSFLDSGSEHLGKGLLDPKIRRLEYQSGLPRWSVASYGAPVEELLAKFATSADIDVHWASEGTSESDSEKDAIRQRPVSLYLPAATSHQIVLIAAGCAGLLGRLEDNLGTQKVTIYNPADYLSLREHISLLSQQAISLWRKFVLTFYSDERLGNAHFAMGLLQSQRGLPAEAIAEYKLVANRFSQMSLAPFALLHSSKLKTNLRDYPGAREDLKQLIEQHPDTEIHGQAYLRLADATMATGLKAEAAQLYERVYNFGLSSESKTASAFGAARCFHEAGAYQDAAKWLIRYINLAEGDENNNLYSAYLLLGQANLALGQYQQACNAFQYALTEQSSREQYIEAITALVKGHIEQGHFVEALDALENIRSVALSQEQSAEMLLLKSRILRMLGLTETAIVSLRDRAEYVSDRQLNAKISFELAQCYIAEGDLESARGQLSQILGVVEPGPLAQRTALELAGVCLKCGQSSQTVSICLQLLDSDVSAEIEKEALSILAAAYNQQNNYDKAALALSGQWK